MNLFVVPSWYPYAREPTSGIFQRDQTLAFAELRGQSRVAVSLWGQGDLTLPVTVPGAWPGFARSFLRHRRRARRAIRDNLVEYATPRVTWSHRLARGRVEAVLDACRENLRRAEHELGRLDLIHAHVSYPGGWVALRLARETGLPYVVTEHMAPFPFPAFRGRSLDELVREPLAAASARVAVSPALAAEMELLGVGPVQYVPNVVDERFFAPASQPQNDPFVFFSLGRLEPRKGFDDLLAAAARLQVPFELRIGGAGREERRLHTLAAQLGLSERVRWLGPLDRAQARSEFQRCDSFVLASRHESFGIVYAEATACGRPVIATRCGGPEAIVTAENGLLVAVGDVGALAAAMQRMTDTASAYDAGVIRAGFLERFSRAAVIDRLEEIYVMAVGGANESGRNARSSRPAPHA